MQAFIVEICTLRAVDIDVRRSPVVGDGNRGHAVLPFTRDCLCVVGGDLPAEEIVGRQGVALDLVALLADKLDANLTQRRCLLDQRRR